VERTNSDGSVNL